VSLEIKKVVDLSKPITGYIVGRNEFYLTVTVAWHNGEKSQVPRRGLREMKGYFEYINNEKKKKPIHKL
jgi:hypothetical protein